MSEEVGGKTGCYYSDCCERKLATAVAMDDEVAEELWRVSAEMVKLHET